MARVWSSGKVSIANSPSFLLLNDIIDSHSIRTIRQSLTALQSSATLSDSRVLFINSPLHSDKPLEISTIYFRASYTPTDFPTPQHWETRILLQRSRAINCPSLPLQLAGGKKVQQVLTQPRVRGSTFFRLTPYRLFPLYIAFKITLPHNYVYGRTELACVRSASQ